MQEKTNKALFFLEKNTSLFLLLAIVFRNGSLFFYPPYGTDHVMIHTAVDNLLQGKGLSFSVSGPDDLSIVLQQPMNEWPPLVGYLIYAVKTVVINSRATDMILMSAGTILLLLALRNIMKMVEINPIFQSILWIIIATNPEPFRMAGISDIYSCMCILWSVALSLGFVKTGIIKTPQLFISSLIFFLPAACRYQYYPVVFIFPVFLIIAGRLLKQVDLIKKGKLSLLLVALLLGTQISLLYFQTGAAARIADDKAGFYFDNLFHMYPFLIKGFLNTSYFENLFFTKSATAKAVLNSLYFIVTVFLLLRGTIFIISQYKKTDANNANGKRDLYLNKGFLLFISLSTIFLLSLLSLIYSPQNDPYGMFTYVKEGRYFLVPTFLLLLLATCILQEQLEHLHRRMFKFYKLLIVFIILINLSLFGKFCYNIIAGKQKIQGASWLKERETVFEEIEDQIQKRKRPVVVVGNKYFSYQPISDSFSIIRNLRQLEAAGLNTTKPIQLLLITQPKPSSAEEKFIHEKKPVLIFAGIKCRMYQLIVEEHTF